MTRSRKRKANEDELFLREAESQLKKVKTDDAERIRPYLALLRQPTEQEAHTLSKAAARKLLAGDIVIDRPIFVRDAADASRILDLDDDRRPIDQLFSWLTNNDEDIEYSVPGKTPAPGTIKTATIRKRFEAHKGLVVDEPHNLTDVVNPFPVVIAPKFTQTLAGNLLSEVMRYLLDSSTPGLCQDKCSGRSKRTPHMCCKKHFLTVTEFTELQSGWRQWQGAFLLAEAGALTQPHYDKWGFATSLVCLEGEIGWCWLANATNEERKDIMANSDDTRDSDRWLYKVLKEGDVMYMPPGTPHLVFRLPKGNQTLAAGSHMVRRCDVGQWVSLLELEVRRAKAAFKKGNKLDEFEVAVWRGLCVGIKHILKHGTESDASYGGKQALDKVRATLKSIKKDL